MIFSGQGHSLSATDFYPQPSGWGRRFVGGSPPAGPNRPPHKASGHLESKTGQVWWVLYGNLRERLPPKSNISPPSMSQSCGGAEGTGNRGTRQCHPKYFVSTPSNFVRIPLGPDSQGNTGSPQENGTFFQSSWDNPTVHSDLDLFTRLKSTGINNSFQVGQG